MIPLQNFIFQYLKKNRFKMKFFNLWLLTVLLCGVFMRFNVANAKEMSDLVAVAPEEASSSTMLRAGSRMDQGKEEEEEEECVNPPRCFLFFGARMHQHDAADVCSSRCFARLFFRTRVSQGWECGPCEAD